jgi:peptidoglycan/LPS O-acetylase OafA/YrhL
MALKYRPEVDGLRAVAVIPVVLYHAGFRRFSGGFVGVDVFFVISGYLITLLLLNDLNADRFSILTFYERRARRILPALVVVTLFCMPMACIFLMPAALKEFAESMISVSLFCSNIFFWHETGYFDVASTLKPLIHTWSLAVEEQYYLLFPLVLLLIWKRARRFILPIFVICAMVSLGLAEWAVRMHPSVAFFFLPTRGWELLLGAILAVIEFERGDRYYNRPIGEVGTLIGLALILYSVCRFNDQTPFPGLHALPPTIGAASIIFFANSKNLVGKLLRTRVFVGIGLISYSTYLWHQPLLAFCRQRSLRDLSETEAATLIVLSLLIGYLSWRFVERPFRDRTHFSRNQIFQFAFASCIVFLTVGTTVTASQGYLWSERRRTIAEKLEARVSVNFGLSAACEGRFTNSPKCRTSDAPEVLVWGDSYAMHLVDGLLASNPQLKIRQATVSNCGPVFDIAPLANIAPVSISTIGAQWARECIATNDEVRRLLRTSRSLKYVVLSSPFSNYVAEDARMMTRDGRVLYGKAAFARYFEYSLMEIRRLGITPIVISPTPSSGFNTGRCLETAEYFDEDVHSCDFRLNQASAQQKDVIDLLDQISRLAKIIWLSDGICINGTCRADQDGVFIYRDGGHLSHEGSTLLGREMNWYGLITQTQRN